MKPFLGVAGELIALALVGWAGFFVPGGSPYLLYVIVVELLATYLIHCPAHYIVGRTLGIGFTKMKLGRTTLAKALPPSLSRFARLIPILTLTTEKSSLARAPPRSAAAMYASGTFASVLSAFVVAAWVTPGASWSVIIGSLGSSHQLPVIRPDLLSPEWGHHEGKKGEGTLIV